MKGLSLIILIITCALPGSAQVINYEIDPTFDSQQLFFRGSVSDILHTSNDQFLIMGMFGGTSLSSGLLSNDGNLVYPNVVGGQKVAEYLNGYLSYGSGIKHVELGTGLTAFSFEFFKSAYSGPLSTQAYDAMVMPDDHILVAGRFFTDSTLMGTAESHLGLRQLCMIDSTGASVAEFPMIRCAEPVNAFFWTLDKLSTGEYIVAGRFSEIEGHQTNNIAKLNSDFSVDTTFVSPLIFQSDVQVRHIDSQDRIWLTTGFGAFQSNPADTIYMCRLLSDGQVDTTYHIPFAVNVLEDWSYPLSFAAYHEDTDGTFIVVGGFTEVNGVPKKGLAKIYDNGELVTEAFEGFGADEAVWGNWVSTYGAGSGVLRSLPDGKLLLGGSFSSFGGEPYSCLVRLQPAGFVDTDDRDNRDALKLYPNPARTHFRIELPEGVEHLELVQLWDLQGRTVRAWPAGQGQFDIEGLPAGMYVVRAEGRDWVLTQKLMLEL